MEDVVNVAGLTPPRVDVAALESALRDRVDAEVRFDEGSRAAYSTDASNYRQVPIGVVVPRSVQAAAEAVRICREHDAPIVSRGGGTSLAGEAVNVAVVIDWTKYCHRLLSVDPAARTCVVEPGIVLDDLNAQLSQYGLEFGPRPSTHSHCALGGMIGNNSCGATAQRAGKTVDNVRRLEILTYEGLRCWVGPGDEVTGALEEDSARGELYRALLGLRDRYAHAVRERFPDIPRRVSGYNLDALLPEQGFNLAKLLVGSEGTLVTVLRAELELVPVVKHKATLVIGYPDIAAAGDAVQSILDNSRPIQLEAVDDRLVEFMHQEHFQESSADQLPAGGSWLMIQFGADSRAESMEQGRHLLAALKLDADDEHVTLTDSPQTQEDLQTAREAGLGVTARPPGMPDTWPGWEDSAVPPERLGDYLRDLRGLHEEFGLDHPSLYGHFGHGCVHVSTPFDLTSAAGVRNFRAFVEKAADLVVSYGGSLSGEHGDGQARGELLERMFGAEIMRGFAELKALFDPTNRMNPGKVIAPYAVDENLRLGAAWRPAAPATHFAYPDDDHSFTRAALRCQGIGNCRQSGPNGGVMCPSYQVTREEEHSTRGRARLLFEMLQGHPDTPVKNGWRSTAVRDALDLCLACKGCKSDCPVEVDMATYKAEFLAQHYKGRIRPMAHYSLGWLPALARIAARAPRTVNAVLHTPGLSALGKRIAGIAAEREAPPFAPETLQAWWKRTHTEEPDPADPRTVLLWPDTFTNHFHPQVGQAAVEVLESAGFRVAIPTEPLCCGLTWISTGQLVTAKKALRRTVQTLRPWIDAGTLVVGLEPSCTAVFRSDAAELLPDLLDLQRLRSRFVTFAEALLHHAPGEWRPSTVDRRAIVQKHCHHHAIMGFQTDVQVLRRAGIQTTVLDSGCCGLAGNFGFERGHYEVSMACAEQALLPAVREADPDTLILADGFSCRTQIEQAGTGRQALHLAEALRLAVEPEPMPRPRSGATSGRLVAGATAGLGLALAGWTTRRLLRGGFR
jgi:FAD/FMN-containing dehydrogenase/Fe-S oxidoreductase